MHEMGIVEQVVSIAAERCGGATVTRLVLEIGRLSTVLPDAVRFAFDVATEGTPLAGATLEIVEVAGSARCRACHATTMLDQPYGCCAACGSVDLEQKTGASVRILELEVRD